MIFTFHFNAIVSTNENTSVEMIILFQLRQAVFNITHSQEEPYAPSTMASAIRLSMTSNTAFA